MDSLRPTGEVRGGRSLLFMTLKFLGIFLVVLFVISQIARLTAPTPPQPPAPSVEASSPVTTAATDTVIAPADVEPIQVEPRTTSVSPEAVYLDLRQPFDPEIVMASALDNSHPDVHYGGPWRPENVVQHDSLVALTVRAGRGGERPTMAEIKSHARYGYGRYRVIMRPSGESGIVSAFFTYTGPWAGDPHDEIDIEFTGKRSDMIEFNYFRNGVRGAFNRMTVDFDVSERMRLYGFDWRPGEIIWYIDGEEVYRTPEGRTDIPSTPGQFYISAWSGVERVKRWTGRDRYGERAQADFACISFTPFGDSSRTCEDMYAEDPQFRTAN